jgi:cytochrome c peroxidase
MKKSLLLFSTVAATIFALESCKPDTQLVSGNEASKLVLPEKAYDYQAEVTSFVQDMPFITLRNTGVVTTPTTPINSNIPQFFNSNIFVDQKGIPRINMLFDGTQNSGAIKNDVATLGRVLFYDKQMSVNNTIACGSCHLQSKAFSDMGEQSEGFKGVKTSRNSLSIANPVLTSNLFWDSRSKSLRDMALQPVQNHLEMGMEDLKYLTTKLNSVSYYQDLFKKAYGSSYITEQGINTALTQFLASMVSHNSKFDVGAKSKFANFDPMENMGKELFMSERLGCTKCHSGVNFSLADENTHDNTGYGPSSGTEGTANIGLNLVYKDNGRANGKFKIPSLRNIELTAPYMHDGRFKSLEQVVEHYNKGINAHPNLDDNLKDEQGRPKKLNLTSIEKTALISFLKTLTDNTYTTDVKYSDPFKQ